MHKHEFFFPDFPLVQNFEIMAFICKFRCPFTSSCFRSANPGRACIMLSAVSRYLQRSPKQRTDLQAIEIWKRQHCAHLGEIFPQRLSMEGVWSHRTAEKRRLIGSFIQEKNIRFDRTTSEICSVVNASRRDRPCTWMTAIPPCLACDLIVRSVSGIARNSRSLATWAKNLRSAHTIFPCISMQLQTTLMWTWNLPPEIQFFERQKN